MADRTAAFVGTGHTLILHAPHGGETVRVPFSSGLSVWEVLEGAGIPVRSGCRGNGACGLCRVRVLAAGREEGEGAGGVPPLGPPAAEERFRLSPASLAAGERLACRLRPSGDLRVEVLGPAGPAGWTSLADTHELTDAVAAVPHGAVERAGRNGVVERAGRTGVAVDLGTTHIRLAWWDLEARRLLATRVGRNPQARFGSDVLSRLTAAAGHGAELAALARVAIGAALHDMVRPSPAARDTARREHVDADEGAGADVDTDTGTGAGDITSVTIVGNTAMLALLSGHPGEETLLGPDTWSRALACGLERCGAAEMAAWRRSWRLAPEARIALVQPLGGFVGSDLLAGLLATRLSAGPPGSLFIDFGTNTEIALWDGRRLWVTSAAGGPAFEGSGIGCGWPAESGAVFRVEIVSDRTAAPRFEVIGGGAPLGLCGSGLVDAVAGLRRAGRLSAAGRFTASAGAGACAEAAIGSGTDGFAIAPGIILRKRDIDIFQRAKAAVAAAVVCLVTLAGMTPRGLNRLCIGGAFGRTLRLDAAIETGLLPQVASDRVEVFSQAALAGCSRLLVAPDSQAQSAALVRLVSVVNMASIPEFEDHFIEQLRLQPFLLK